MSLNCHVIVILRLRVIAILRQSTLSLLTFFVIFWVIFLTACMTPPIIRPAAQQSQSHKSQTRTTPQPAALAITSPQLKRTPLIVENNAPVNTSPLTVEPIITYDVDAKVIGAVLPLTGKNAGIGQHALNALRMGLGLDLNKSDNKFRLAIFDSQSNPELAAKGAHALVSEDKAIVLLGGFTAKEALAIAEQAEKLKTPYIGFSQKSGLTAIGNYVFRNSVTPAMQVDKLVQFAFDKLSAKKFALLFPNDTYGVEFSSLFWDHVLARGGEITAAQTYDPKETDFSKVVQKLVGTYYIEARADEYKERLREIKDKDKTKTTSAKKPLKKNLREQTTEENLLTPIVDFDVLFVPDSSRALGQIMAFMKYNEIRSLTYLGTNIWNSTDLPKRTAGAQARVYFIDALDVSEGAAQPDVFFKNYQELYGEVPSLVEAQVYESSRVIKEQLISGINTRSELADSLRSLGRRPGTTGELRMSAQRELERPLHVLTLDSGFIKKIE